jgi:hypothetical protein
MDDGLDGARALLPGTPLESLTALGGSDRSIVQRVSAGPRTLIVKTFTEAGRGWVRESAALSVMPPEAPAPRLVAAGDAPPVVVMSDVGTGGNIADALLGDDPEAAQRAMVSWATTIAALHTSTAGTGDAFRAALAARAGVCEVPDSAIRDDLESAARKTAEHCADLGVDVPDGALDELLGLAGRLGADGPAALTPADACPDNNVWTGDDLVLVDFEGAQWRHIAWDVAYLAVPWPTCWCSWRVPDGVARVAVNAYRAAYPSPYVDGPDFDRDVAAASVGWAFWSVAWFLPRALSGDPPPPELARRAPTRRAVILHRLAMVRENRELPALAELAGRMRDALADRWGEVALAYAPAFVH